MHPDQLASEESGFNRVYTWFHTEVFLKDHTCLFLSTFKGYTKFFVHYLFFGTSKAVFGQQFIVIYLFLDKYQLLLFSHISQNALIMEKMKKLSLF